MNRTIIPFLNINNFVDLAPTFFDKQMNIAPSVLSNLFDLWYKALSQFSENNLAQYDALVGENACHIRASLWLDLLKKSKMASFISAKNELMNHLQELKALLSNMVLKREEELGTIKQLITNRFSPIHICNKHFNKFKAIIDAYMLSYTKESRSSCSLTLNEYTNYHRLGAIGLGKYKAKTLLSSAQKFLSHYSCEYVIHEANVLKNNGLIRLLHLKKDLHQRSALPQFIVAKIIYQRALQKNVPILLRITRCLHNQPFEKLHLIFYPNISRTDYEYYTNIEFNTPCLVLQGSVNYDSIPETKQQYVERLCSYSLMDLILANFAMHPQYIGELKNNPPPFIEATEMCNNNLQLKTIEAIEKDFEAKKSLALKSGCCIQKPTLLFLNHIFADSSDNYPVESIIINADFALNAFNISSFTYN